MYYKPIKNIKNKADVDNPQIIVLGKFEDGRENKRVISVSSMAGTPIHLNIENDAGAVAKEAFADIMKRAGFIIKDEIDRDNPPDVALTAKVIGIEAKNGSEGFLSTKYFSDYIVKMEIYCEDKRGAKTNIDIEGTVRKEGGVGDLAVGINEALIDGVLKLLDSDRFLKIIKY